ncbi:MAG: hypothetical protein ACLTW9_24445 [Enterocloster sp.]
MRNKFNVAVAEVGEQDIHPDHCHRRGCYRTAHSAQADSRGWRRYGTLPRREYGG